MRYKAVAGLALATTAALALAGCSNSSGGGGGDAATITVSTATSERAQMEAVVAAFEESSDYGVELTVADTDNLQTTLRTQLSSGTAPDVFFAWPGDGNPMAMRVLQEAGLIADLSEYDFAARVPEGFSSVAQIDGATWIAPVTTVAIGAIYNMTAMEENGYAVPSTWSELLESCATVAANGQSLLSYGGATGWNTQLTPYALASTLVYGPETDFADRMAEGDVTFADSAWQDVFGQFSEMADAGCFQPDFSGTAYEDSMQLVADGQAMGTVQVSASIAPIRDAAPEGTELSQQPIPANNDAASTFLPAALGAAYAVNAAADNAEGAAEFVEFLTSEEGQNIYAETGGAIPALPSESFQLDPALETVQQYIDEGRTVPFPDQLWPNPRVQQTLFEVLQQLLNGSTEVSAALTALDDAYAQE